MDSRPIAAISSPPGTGAIGIVRLSGEGAPQIAGKIFTPYNSEIKLEDMRGYRGALGKVWDGDTPVDEVVAFVYRAPHSYTGEDLVELCTHGSAYLAGEVLRLCVQAGARPAQPGEFTKRAFLNGKIDLSGAEAVMDLISAQSKAATRAALAAKDGKLSGEISTISGEISAHCAHIAAWCDYPEEDLIPVDERKLEASLREILSRMEYLLSGYERGKLIRGGINTAIIGNVNVGKSTLMNLLCGQRRSIVTQIPGTTRDVVTASINAGGLILNLSDTAGIRETHDPAEHEGVSRSLREIETADIILAVFDSSRPLEDADREILTRLEGKTVIGVLNKCDLAPAIDEKALSDKLSRVVKVSAFTGEGRDSLEQTITQTLRLEDIDPSAATVANERQRLCLTESAGALSEAISALSDGVTLDAVSVCLDSALEHLLTLTGQRATDAVIDQVFARFCVGK